MATLRKGSQQTGSKNHASISNFKNGLFGQTLNSMKDTSYVWEVSVHGIILQLVKTDFCKAIRFSRGECP